MKKAELVEKLARAEEELKEAMAASVKFANIFREKTDRSDELIAQMARVLPLVTEAARKRFSEEEQRPYEEMMGINGELARLEVEELRSLKGLVKEVNEAIEASWELVCSAKEALEIDTEWE